MDKPLYQKTPIKNIDSLAELLAIDKNQLVQLADNAASFYHPRKKKKMDGSFRKYYSVEDELKYLQKRIVETIYDNIYFPKYLQGSIKDHKTPRNHITAASTHTGAIQLVKMDIRNFFPSLNSKVIFDIWKHFFNFSEPVAEVLTKLTTLNGFLPQGAPTSSGLANLAFWDTEFAVVDNLERNGFTYTRFVDDVTVSSKSRPDSHELNAIFGSISDMFRTKGVKANHKKSNVLKNNHPMIVNNLNINSGTPTLPKKKRSQIRSAVKDCEKRYPDQKQSEAYKNLWKSALERVNYLSKFHFRPAQALFQRLQAIRPIV